MEDGQQIFGEFRLGSRLRFRVENHDAPTVAFNEVFDEGEAESRQSVSVGNHNFKLVAAQKSSQYGTQPRPLEVKSAADVLDNLGFRVDRLHPGDLSGEIVSLFGRRHPAITHPPGVSAGEISFDIVQSPAGRSSDGPNNAVVGVLPQSVGV